MKIGHCSRNIVAIALKQTIYHPLLFFPCINICYCKHCFLNIKSWFAPIGANDRLQFHSRRVPRIDKIMAWFQRIGKFYMYYVLSKDFSYFHLYVCMTRRLSDLSGRAVSTEYALIFRVVSSSQSLDAVYLHRLVQFAMKNETDAKSDFIHLNNLMIGQFQIEWL